MIALSRARMLPAESLDGYCDNVERESLGSAGLTGGRSLDERRRRRRSSWNMFEIGQQKICSRVVGYQIPKGARILSNHWSINLDPDIRHPRPAGRVPDREVATEHQSFGECAWFRQAFLSRPVFQVPLTVYRG
jgi:hypothetical protein